MKRRILFVDDEPFLLEGLQRAFSGIQEDWELAFAESGNRALELMAHASFDAVVSDLHMPGMDGVQLLQQVRRCFPQSMRLILSGYVDQKSIMQCVGVTHQYLVKPCPPEVLKSTLTRAFAGEQAVENQPLKQLIARMDRVPSVPSLYLELLQKLKSPEVALEEIALVIAQDMGMTATVLKLVNSAFFGLGRKISSTVEAVSFLGLDTIKYLVLSLKAFSQFEKTRLGGISLEVVWQHSLKVSAAAKQIAGVEQAGRKISEESFVSGLLHDIGKLVLASNFAPQYEQAVRAARERKTELLDAERECFGANHADVGAYLLGLWGLPQPIVEAIALHHAPAKAANNRFDALTAVHAANVLVQKPDQSTEGIAPPHLDLLHLANLGLVDHVESWRERMTERLLV